MDASPTHLARTGHSSPVDISEQRQGLPWYQARAVVEGMRIPVQRAGAMARCNGPGH